MKERIIEATNEIEGTNFKSLEECMEIYSPIGLIDLWLRYEGIIGYSYQIERLFEEFYILVPKQ